MVLGSGTENEETHDVMVMWLKKTGDSFKFKF
jgi:hypothetical protein